MRGWMARCLPPASTRAFTREFGCFLVKSAPLEVRAIYSEQVPGGDGVTAGSGTKDVQWSGLRGTYWGLAAPLVAPHQPQWSSLSPK